MMSNWYRCFFSKRLIKYIDDDSYAYEGYGLSIIPDWVCDQAKELHNYYKATQVIK